MTTITFGDLCCIFCCPPCPSSIASKMAFIPPKPTYIVEDLPGNNFYLHLNSKAEWLYSQKELDHIEILKTTTVCNNTIICMMIEPCVNAKYTIIFSHANAVDIGMMSSYLYNMAIKLNVNVFTYDYSGYGRSTGFPNEKNIYADSEAAWNLLINKYSIKPENIILYGQSIGSVTAIECASKHHCAALIVHSGLASGIRVAFPDIKRTPFFDPFPNIKKIHRVSCPTLFIHGTDDDVVDFSHGLALYERSASPVTPLWLEGAGHNDIEFYQQFSDRLYQFINHDFKDTIV